MIRSQVLAAAVALATGLSLATPPSSADVLAGSHELVVLAEPAAPTAGGGSGPLDLTLTWTVREIFAGEPASVTIAVRHEALEPAQVKSLGSGGRWIVLADPDPARPGRWRSAMPLRATPAAVEAFRKWSAPPDVRPERDLGSVVAEVREAGPVERVETVPAPAPAVEAAGGVEPASEPETLVAAAPPAESSAAVAEGPVVETLSEDPVPEAPKDRDAAPASVESERTVIADSRDPQDVTTGNLASPEPEAAPAALGLAPVPDALPTHVEVVRIAEVDVPADGGPPRHQEMDSAPVDTVTAGRRGPLEEPPHTWQPVLQPPTGPGLPPPPPSQPLGLPPSLRDDLKKAKPPAREDA